MDHRFEEARMSRSKVCIWAPAVVAIIEGDSEVCIIILGAAELLRVSGLLHK